LRRLNVAEERWPLKAPFVIARGAKTEARVVVVTLQEGEARGRGEATPYPRYGESVEDVLASLQNVAGAVEGGADRGEVARLLAPGAARNALDCALWDLEAKRSGSPAWRLAGLEAPRAVQTAFTLSLDRPAAMAAAARAAAFRPLLKLKIGGADDLDCVEAVRAAAPFSRLVLDANEGLSFDEVRRLAPAFSRLGVELLEQPLPAGADEELEGWDSPVLLCADESAHVSADLPRIIRRYGAINVKLDKAGGLTEALALRAAASAAGLKIMAGCMVATSLAMAPAMLIAQDALMVDLDGPLLLSEDRLEGLAVDGSWLSPPIPALWG
jgi:L-alanine-DL-glutamate epimerase-like enolase superfamily enzyme